MKNIAFINKKVALELNLKEELVSKVNDYYWNTVKKTVRNLEDEFIHIKKIGNFEVSNFKLDSYIKFLRQYIMNIRNSYKYTHDFKEEVLKEYKRRYALAMSMQREVKKTLHFRQNYKKDV